MEESVRRKDRLAAVGRVAAGLAHEIRNPFGAIRGAIQVLESSTPPGSIHSELMDIISKGVRSAEQHYHELSQLRDGRRSGEFLETDVAEAVREMFKLLRHSPDIKESHVLVDDSGSESIVIAADTSQLKQIFWNLARNAIQAMPDGGNFGSAWKILSTIGCE